ncbi:Protein-N(5)-glutamine methyltransferase PrmC [Minicystis rosea]|nr:Protein-N(5)-glutamine methyltransferase PrmC [Minicystis rosea]
MALPDISRFATRLDVLRDLGRTLKKLGVTFAAAAPVVSAAGAVPPAHRQPIRAFHLRKMKNALGYAMRMFMFRDPVTEAEGREALGDLLPALLDVGLLGRSADGGIVSQFILVVLDDLYILADELAQGDEAVMGFGETTIALTGAAFPRRPVERVLEIGCGSGTSALFLARAARKVVATDISERAVAIARANAALNGVESLDLRQGDLFAPVAGETFDLIVSQPPFIPQPEGVADVTFLYGGRRGDELSLSLLRNLVAHLTPGGRAVLFVEWPEYGEIPLETRLRDAIGPNANLLLLHSQGNGLDVHAATYAAGLHPGLGPAFEAETLLRRAHFEREGIRTLTPSLTVVERTTGAPGWTASINIQQMSQVMFSSERIDKIIAARAVAADRDRLLSATLRMPEGTLLAQEQIGPGAEVPSTLTARFPPKALIPQVDMTMELLGLLTCVHEAETAREGILRFAEMLDMPVDQAMSQGGAAIEEALLHGVLELQKA